VPRSVEERAMSIDFTLSETQDTWQMSTGFAENEIAPSAQPTPRTAFPTRPAEGARPLASVGVHLAQFTAGKTRAGDEPDKKRVKQNNRVRLHRPEEMRGATLRSSSPARPGLGVPVEFMGTPAEREYLARVQAAEPRWSLGLTDRCGQRRRGINGPREETTTTSSTAQVLITTARALRGLVSHGRRVEGRRAPAFVIERGLPVSVGKNRREDGPARVGDPELVFDDCRVHRRLLGGNGTRGQRLHGAMKTFDSTGR